jgi:hypothetical protein
LEKSAVVCNAVASAFEHLNFIVKSLHEPASLSINKIVCDFLHMTFKCLQEAVEAREFAIDDPLHPAFNFSLSLALR